MHHLSYSLFQLSLITASPVVETEGATAETPGLCDTAEDGFVDVDDPAIWVHPRHRGRSLVVGTLKEGGIAAYDLDGVLVERIEDEGGRFNNVEIVYDVAFGWFERADIAVVSDRGRDQLRFYRVDEHGLTDVTAPDMPLVFAADADEVATERTVYGLAATRLPLGLGLAFASRADVAVVGRIFFWGRPDGTVAYLPWDEVRVPAAHDQWTPCLSDDGAEPHVEGLVIDRRHGVLYFGQEQVGVWRAPLHRPWEVELVDVTTQFGVPYTRTWDADEEEYACEYDFEAAGPEAGEHLVADVEGMTLYETSGGGGHLVVSSQGEDTFVVYDRGGDNAHVASFTIGAGAGDIDGTEHTDGIAVTSLALGDRFPHGLLVAHDGENEGRTCEDGEASTNFKLVPWEHVAAALALAW